MKLGGTADHRERVLARSAAVSPVQELHQEQPMPFFTPEQREELRAHLSEAIPSPQLDEALSSLDFMCKWAAAEIRLDEADPGCQSRERAALSRHLGAIKAHADNLRVLLGERHPLPGTAGIDWDQVERDLATISDAAQLERDARQRTGGGRPAFEWRDDLIALTFSLYPAEAQLKSAGSHFELTVELLLGFLGRDVEDVHGPINQALARRPDPPFRLEAKYP
jgi:hypothetical protein